MNTLDDRITEAKKVEKLVRILDKLDECKVPYYLKCAVVVVVDRYGKEHEVYRK